MSITGIPQAIITSLHTYCYVPQRICRQLDLLPNHKWYLVNTWLKWLYSEGWLTPIHQMTLQLRPEPPSIDVALYLPEVILPAPQSVDINRLFQIYIHHHNFFEAAKGRKINRALLCRGVDSGLSYVPLLMDIIWLGGTPSLSCIDLFDRIVHQRNSTMETQIVIPVLTTATSNKFWLIRASLVGLTTANGALLRKIWQDPKIIRNTDYYGLLVGTLQQYFNNTVVDPQFYLDLDFLVRLATSTPPGSPASPDSVFLEPPILSIDPNTNLSFWTFYRNRGIGSRCIEYVVGFPRPLPYYPTEPRLRWRLLQEWLAVDDDTAVALKSKIPIRNEIQLSDLSSLNSDEAHVSTTLVSEFDAITSTDFQLLTEIYHHEVQRGTEKIGIDASFLEIQILKGLRYRPYLARVSKYLRWWPSRLIALIKEIEEFSELGDRYNIQPLFPVTEWEAVYPAAVLGINNLTSETIWSSFSTLEGPHRTLDALNTVEVYLQSSNIASSKYPKVLERLGFNYQWNFICTLYSSNYHLCCFVLTDQKKKILKDTQVNNRQLDQPIWTRLIMRNQAIGFLRLIFERFNFRHTGPRVSQSLYSALLSALLSMNNVDLRICDLLIRHDFSSWIVDFIAMYGGYFAVESILSVIQHLSPSIGSNIFSNITSNFTCTARNLPRGDLCLGPDVTSRLWRPEDLLLVLDHFKKSGHQLYLTQISNRSDHDSITMILDALRSPAALSSSTSLTSVDNIVPARKRRRPDTSDSKSNTRRRK